MPSQMWINSFVSSAFNDAWRGFDTLPDALPEKNILPIPPNIGHGNSVLDDLYYYMARETLRALARFLFGVELENVSPYTIDEGHAHNQNQDAAMAWRAPVQATLWFDEGAVTEPGAGVIDQTTETDVCWVPFSVPNGCSLAYLKLRVGTQAADDIGYVRCRIYSTAAMNGTEISGTALAELKSKDGGLTPLTDQWLELSPIDTTALTTTDSIQQGWIRVSGLVAVAGDKAWVSEVLYGLREGA